MPFDPHAVADYVVTDPPLQDIECPAEHFVTHFISQDVPVHALIWIAQGEQAKGCVIISCQAFGGDRLESLIIPLLNMGISVMTFQPRGMWDREHEYSLISALDDLNAGVEFIRTADAAGKTTPNGKGYRIDPERIAVLGLSGAGGSVAFSSCAELDHVKYGIAIAPSNHELFRDLNVDDVPTDWFSWLKSESAGRIDVLTRLKGMTSGEIDRLSIIHNIPRLLSKKLLLIGATNDMPTPLKTCHIPIRNAFRDAGATNFTDIVLDSDHFFLTKRIALARIVTSWLRTECGF
ncbi:hypothetical protein WG908_12025 [Sphingobium sp. AN641]|uniref:alpha/beta hydrolase family protein n=1 Tax=Sphingobium sp. AN641 TaxID=3133443 RepID=UPI0030BC3E3C